MSVKTDSELITQANVIRDETDPSGNTKARVAQMFKDIIDSKPNVDTDPIETVYWDFVAESGAYPTELGKLYVSIDATESVLAYNTWFIAKPGVTTPSIASDFLFK